MLLESAFKYLYIILCLFLTICIANCGDEASDDSLHTESGAAVFSIIWPDEGPEIKKMQEKGNPSIDCTGIFSIEVNVYEYPNNKYLTGDSFLCTDGEGTVYGIPVGKNRQFVVSALGVGNEILYQGKSDAVTIFNGRVVDVGDIQVSKVGPKNERPIANIIKPLERAFNYGDSITFEGWGEDAEDGKLFGGHLKWESDIDGEIGKVSTFIYSNLSSGMHTITLTVTDSKGISGTTTIKILVIGGNSFKNSIGMIFNRIPSGTFTMGSPEDEPGWQSDESQHEVTLPQSFYMQTTEVTQGQWKTVMGTNPSTFQKCGDDCPVERVSWYDCAVFCNRLSEMEGLTPSYYSDINYINVLVTPPDSPDSIYWEDDLTGTVYWKEEANGYRLPTEAEWEYAARADSEEAFANGEITVTDCSFDPNLDAMGWYCGNSDVSYAGCSNLSAGGLTCAGTHPVMQKEANSFGLYDMHGNVYEWCQDHFSIYVNRILRGGSWYSTAAYCRSASRYSFVPDLQNFGAGFRLALLPDQ